MMRHFSKLCSLLIFATSLTVQAEPIWHCSRSQDSEQEKSKISQPTSTIDSLSFDESEKRTIEIQIIDLLNVYSGGTVYMGDRPLLACFYERGNPLTALAMSTLDIDPASLASLANSDAIVKSKVIPVRNETQMEICIAKNHPAIGFLPEVVESDRIGPCF